MGRDKASLEVGGEAMAVRVAAALRAAGADPVVAVGGDPTVLSALGLPVIPDDEPGAGPLAATLTALRRSDAALVVVLSCDLVAPSSEAIATVVDALARADAGTLAAIPVVDGHRQWTHAAWRTAALARLEAAHAEGARSLRRAGADLPIATVEGISALAVADADHPGDLPGGR